MREPTYSLWEQVQMVVQKLPFTGRSATHKMVLSPLSSRF